MELLKRLPSTMTGVFAARNKVGVEVRNLHVQRGDFKSADGGSDAVHYTRCRSQNCHSFKLHTVTYMQELGRVF